MTSIARTAGESGALFQVYGVIPVNASWNEDIYFREDGIASNISTYEFKITLRCSEAETSATATIDMTNGLSIENDSNGTPSILRVTVDAGYFNAYSGDYICDIAAIDSSDNVTLFAHGIVTLRNNPPVF